MIDEAVADNLSVNEHCVFHISKVVIFVHPTGEKQKPEHSLGFIASNGDSRHPTAEFRVNVLLDVIRANPGKRANELASLIGKSVQTGERYVRALKVDGSVEFRGAPKTGGYYCLK